MNVPYVSSKSLWIGFDNVRSVTLKVTILFASIPSKSSFSFQMKFLKEHGYGGVIIWSFDLDDKTGDVCKEGPFPLFNAAKRELLILPDHLANTNRKCLDDNNTLSSELRSNGIRLTNSQSFFFSVFCLTWWIKPK